MYNKLYIYFYDLYSPVASFFLCVCVCMCVRAFVCVHLWKERESNHEQTVCGTSGSNLRENELGGLFRSVTSSMTGKLNFISTY